MLCKRIIFTNENVNPEFTDYIKNKCKSCKMTASGNEVEIDEECDDEELYNVCCALKKYILPSAMNNYVWRTLADSYSCFNRDERNLICSAVLSKDSVAEISGRMFVYLKVNPQMNPEGFLQFMCRDIIKQIVETTEDEADRLIEINDEFNMIETLKYFSDISPECVPRVVLNADSAGIKITNEAHGKGSCFAEYSADDTDILAELVTLNPGCIEIHGREEFLKNEMSAVIQAVFGNRIEYK